MTFTTALSAQDTSYVRRFDFGGRINGGLRYNSSSVRISTLGEDRIRLANSGLDFRIGGRYRWMSYTFSIPIADFTDGTGQENSRGFGLGLRLWRPKGYFRARFRNLIGLELTEQDDQMNFREDLRLFTAGVFAYYVLDHEHFSVRSSFNQRDRQLQSGGSMLLGGLINRQRLKTDMGLVAPRASGELGDITRFAQSEVGLNVGYVYTLTYGKKGKGYVTPLLVGGPEMRFTTIEEQGKARERENVRVDIQWRALLAVGRNGNRNFVALVAEYRPTFDRTDNLRTRSRTITIELRLGRRL